MKALLCALIATMVLAFAPADASDRRDLTRRDFDPLIGRREQPRQPYDGGFSGPRRSLPGDHTPATNWHRAPGSTEYNQRIEIRTFPRRGR